MGKKIVGIVSGVALVAVLGVGAAFLLKTTPEDETDSSSEESSSAAVVVDLTEEDANDVTSIDVTNATGSFEVIRTQEGDDDNNAVFAIAGWEDLPMNTSTLWTLPNNTASLSTVDLVEENASDLAKFGLDDDTAIHVTLHFADETSYSFRVGNATSDTTYTYLAPEDSDTVYTVKTSLVANFSNAATDFVSTTILEEPDDDDYPIVNYLELERQDLDYVIRLEYDETSQDDEVTGGTMAAHEMVSPVPAYLNVDNSTEVITGMFGLTAETIAVPHPETADFESCGLSEPFGTAVMDCDDGNTYTLTFSTKQTDEDGTAFYYAYLDCVNGIYKVSEDNMVWATTTPTNIASKLVIASYVWDIGSLHVSVEDQTFDFTVTGSSQDDAVVTLNGESTDSERYRQFYSFLLNTSAETIDLTQEAQGDALATISFETQDGSFSRELCFYAIDDYTCLITVNGKSAYTCRRSYLDTLLRNMEKYDTEEDFATNWS
jgi:hypothetical protein